MSLTSRFLKAVVLSTWLYSLLLWAYICIRIVFTTSEVVYPSNQFIDNVPGLTFLNLGISSFLLSFICLIIYLTFWGKARTT
jgi:hypothetical protein